MGRRTTDRGAGPASVSKGTTAAELGLGASLLGAALMAGWLFIRRPWPDRLDRKGYALLPPDPSSRILHDLTNLGSMTALVVGVALILAFGLWRDWARAIACAVGPVAAVVLVQVVLKPFVDRRTGYGALTYPSGTVTAATALATSALLISPRVLRPLIAGIGAATLVAVSIAVVALRWHYPTDAIGGACVGAGVVLFLDGLSHLPYAGGDRTGRTKSTMNVESRRSALVR